MYATVDKHGYFTGAVYAEMTQDVRDWHADAGFTWVIVEKSPKQIGKDGEYGRPTTEEKLATVKQVLRLDDTSLRENVKVTVGAGGDFPTINAAVLRLSRFTPDLGVTAEVELQSGFVMMEQLFVEGVDLGWITITGVDAETIINEPSLTRVLDGRYPAFGVKGGGTLPAIGQLFRFSSKGDSADSRDGVVASGAGSSADILSGCGVQDAGSYGIYAAEGSTINATGADASGAGSHGIFAYSGSTINAAGANASGAGGHGLFAAEGSTINATGADASDAGNYGLHAAHGSTINAQNANASGAGSYGIFATSSSTINAAGADASGAGSSGIFASDGSTVNAYGADASGAGQYGIRVYSGSTINAHDVTGTLSQTANTVTSDGAIFQE